MVGHIHSVVVSLLSRPAPLLTGSLGSQGMSRPARRKPDTRRSHQTWLGISGVRTRGRHLIWIDVTTIKEGVYSLSEDLSVASVIINLGLRVTL